MTDLIERAQEREQQDRELALGQVKPLGQGLAECEVCGAPISAVRQQLGARKCLPHQSEVEQRLAKRGARTCV